VLESSSLKEDVSEKIKTETQVSLQNLNQVYLVSLLPTSQEKSKRTSWVVGWDVGNL